MTRRYQKAKEYQTVTCFGDYPVWIREKSGHYTAFIRDEQGITTIESYLEDTKEKAIENLCDFVNKFINNVKSYQQ